MVKNVVLSLQADKFENIIEFIELARKRKVNIIVLKAGDILKIDRETNFEVLFPDEKNIISDNKINNNSLVIKLKYKNFSMLFTGDIEEEGEEAILKKYANEPEKLKSYVLKVAHHGSKTSSTAKFIEAVKPEAVLIGVGKNNLFNHPNQEILERFKKFNIKIYRTDKNGEIIMRVKDSKLKIVSKFK